jgi:hypothetical protein
MGPNDVVKVETFFGLPAWLLVLLFVAIMMATSEAGYALGLRAKIDEKAKGVIPTIATAILAVLGLLLGFTMSMAVSRYDTRRYLVLDEANALGTAYLRAQVVPQPESTELQDLLRQLVDVRTRYAEGAIDAQRMRKARAETEELQGEIWARATAVAQRDPRSVPAGLLLQALNNAFDVENSRWTAFLSHVPESVIYVNALMGVIAVLMVGYGFGLAGQCHRLSVALLVISVSVVLGVIIDLDRPRSGVIRVSQQPMIELQRQLAAPKR